VLISPDQFDALDRRIIAALQMDGRANWTEIAERSGSSLATVTRRGQHLLASGAVRVGVSSNINSPAASDLFVLRIGCRAGTQMRVLSALSERTDLRFLSLVTGSSDLFAELVCPRGESLHERLINEIQTIDGVESCESDLVLHTYKITQTWAQELMPAGGRAAAPPTEPHACDPSHLDDTDREIVALLREDGRASLRSVAEVLHVNESTVRRRFEALRERGCVLVLTLVAASALGYESELILNVSASPARLDAVAQELGRYVGVRYLAATLGCSLVCEVIMPSTEDVYQFVTQGLGKIDGVLGWSASVELLTVKRGFIETPWWRLAGVGSAKPPQARVGSSGD
jgi:DNA-binding Lrp family transcriptional regulator